MNYGFPDDLAAELNDSAEFLIDPEGRRSKLLQLALIAKRQRRISEEQMCDFLDMVDAGHNWALIELEEAHAIGLFSGRTYHPLDGIDYWDGKELRGSGINKGDWCAVGRTPKKG